MTTQETSDHLPIGTPYHGKIECKFNVSGKKIRAQLNTKDLYIRSVEKDDVPHLVKLFGNAEVMKHYATGKTKTAEEITKRVVDSWIPRWEEKGNPFSAFVICKRDDKATFVGFIVLGGGEYSGFDDNKDAGYSEMAYILDRKFWGQGYGKQAAAAIIRGYAPELKAREYKVATNVENQVEYRPLGWICATSRIDKDEEGEFYSGASIKILTGLGFKCFNTSSKFGNLRGHFGLKV